MTSDEQLDLWVEGKSFHNYERYPPDGECCPDFSCCDITVNTPIEIRKKFKEANEETRFKMLGMFLSGMIMNVIPDKKIYISGDAEINDDLPEEV